MKHNIICHFVVRVCVCLQYFSFCTINLVSIDIRTPRIIASFDHILSKQNNDNENEEQ